jgi:hypothetical protein
LIYSNDSSWDSRFFLFSEKIYCKNIFETEKEVVLQHYYKNYFYYDTNNQPKTSFTFYNDNVFRVVKVSSYTYNLIDNKDRKLVISDSYDNNIIINHTVDGYTLKSAKTGKYIGIAKNGNAVLLNDDSSWDSRWYPVKNTLKSNYIENVFQQGARIYLLSYYATFFYYDTYGNPTSDKNFIEKYNVFTVKLQYGNVFKLADSFNRNIVISDSYDDNIIITQYSESDKNGYSLKSSKTGKFFGCNSNGKIILYNNHDSWDSRWFPKKY